MKKKIIATLSIVLMFTTCCSMFTGCSASKKDNGGNSDTSGDTNGSEITENSYDYGYSIPDNFTVTDADGKEQTIVDAVKLFVTNPSKDIPNEIKEANLDGKMNDLIEIKNNVDDYNKCLMTNEEIETMKSSEDGDGQVEVGVNYLGKVQECDIGLDTFNYSITKDIINDGCYAISDDTANTISCGLDKKNFKSEKDYYDATYTIMKKVLDNLSSDELAASISPMKTGVSLGSLSMAADERNYDILFDAVMNGIISISYQTESGLMIHIEVQPDVQYIVEGEDEAKTTDAFYCYSKITFAETSAEPVHE